MDIQEIRRYIEVSSGYIEVDRSYPEKYQGIYRLDFPKNFSKFWTRTYMARGVFLNMINPENNFEWTSDLIDKIGRSRSEFYKY